MGLRQRPELFDALIAHSFEGDLVEASFGDRRGWIIIDPASARDLLRRRLPKGRSTASRKAAGGYPSLSGAEFHRGRRDVVVALAHAASDTKSMATSLAASIGPVPPPREDAPAVYTRWMLHDLAGGGSELLDLDVLIDGVEAAVTDAEAAQDGNSAPRDTDISRSVLTRALAERVDDAGTAFLATMRELGWSTPAIVEELIGLALAGWESSAAAVTTARTLGLSESPTAAEVAELLRLYPPSWLIVRQLTGDEPFGASGELAVVSPWLSHRSPAWRDAHRFDPARTDAAAALPFGAGPRRCPADSYARAQIAVALGAFGGAEPRPARPALIGRRSAALIPDPETTP